jgi:hypothetical protein
MCAAGNVVAIDFGGGDSHVGGLVHGADDGRVAAKILANWKIAGVPKNPLVK